MKIKDKWYPGRPSMSIQEAVHYNILQAHNDYAGAIETVSAKVTTLTEMFARLLDDLASKNLVSDQGVIDILGKFTFEEDKSR